MVNQPSPRFRRLIATTMGAALLATACTNKASTPDPTEPRPTSTKAPETTPPTTPETSPTGTNANLEGEPGTRFNLTLANAPVTVPPATTPDAVNSGDPLSPAQIDAVTNRLPKWLDIGSGEEVFRWPASTLTRPRPGKTVQNPFGTTNGTPPVVAPTELKVLRSQPKGDVPVAPFFTITFNQPMVPVGTVSQLQASDVPVKVTPAIEGTWQWLGTSTLRFDASTKDSDGAGFDRLPMATKYIVEVPAGTKSASGAPLAAAETFTFSTPAPTVESFCCEGSSLSLNPVFVASFDQRIDPVAVLKTIKMTAGGKPVEIKLVSEAELNAPVDAVRRQRGEFRPSPTNYPKGRWLAFRPVAPLPTNTAISIVIGPGVPSAEGPLTSSSPVSYGAQTYGPLRVTESSCGETCGPGSPLSINFSNPLDPEKFPEADAFTVTPAIPGMRVGNYGSGISISGNTKARTQYIVTVPATLTDTFGQTLGKAETITFKVGPAQKQLVRLGDRLITLDPNAAKPAVSINTVNYASVRLRAYKVTPKDFRSYNEYISAYYDALNQGKPLPKAPWPQLADRVIAIKGEADAEVETAIPLSDFLTNDLGHVVVMVEPTERIRPQSDLYWANSPTSAWLQATKIGLDVLSDNKKTTFWTTDLATGKPLAEVAITSNAFSPLTTGADGTVSGPAQISNPVATKGGDVAFLPVEQNPSASDTETWYVFDDRGTYRPGEKVSVKGWIRRNAWSDDAQLALISPTKVDYTVTDAAGVELLKGITQTSPLGGFDMSFDLPAGANAGPASIQLSIGTNSNGSHSFAIQDFRRPEFEVTTKTETPLPIVSASSATVSLNASYYSGGPLAGSALNWQVSSSDTSYSPPGWDQFSFGKWIPWWIDFGGGSFRSDVEFGDRSFPGGPSGEVKNFTGTTGPDGTHRLQISFAGADGALPDLPKTVTATGVVEDVNRQALSSSTNMIVHPSKYYVGLRSDRPFVKEGDPLVIQAIATDVDGKASPGRQIIVTASRMEWTSKKGVWKEEALDPQTCTKTSEAKAVDCSFDTKIGGRYNVVAKIADERGGRNRSELDLYVTGALGKPNRDLQREELTMIPNSKTYKPGDTAEVFIQAPFASGKGLLTTSRYNVTSTQPFDVIDGTAVVRVPVSDPDIPGVELFAEVVGSAQRLGDDGKPLVNASSRPAFAVGTVNLDVSTASRTLAVTATPKAATLRPGGKTQVDVSVKNANGAGVQGAEFALVVVDESVLSLSGYTTIDPIKVFYSGIGSALSPALARDSIVLAIPELARAQAVVADETAAAAALEAAPAPAGGAKPAVASMKKSSFAEDKALNQVGGPAIDDRTNLNALAVFAPKVTTDGNGLATIDVPLPDNVTRYRVMVIAVSDANKFGFAESAITAKLPLTVRPSLPRFLNFGDAFELPVVVQNQTDKAMNIDVVVQAANLNLTGPAGERVTVPANNRVEVRFPATAKSAGTAKVRIAAASVQDTTAADATTIELPVYTPATAEAFATYGVVDEGAIEQPALTPTKVWPQVGGLDITTSSTALQGLTDAVLYLDRYPYQSSDAYAARILAIASLADVLDQFNAPDFPGKEKLLAKAADDVKSLISLRRGDGSWGYWNDSRLPDPYITVHAVHALVLAKAAGINVPANAIEQGMSTLQNIEQVINQVREGCPEECFAVVRAYAFHVRTLNGDKDTQGAEALWRQFNTALPLEGAAWLWPSLGAASGAEVERRITNAAVDTASNITFTTGYSDRQYVTLSSDRRSDAVILDALITQRPQSTMIPKVVSSLLAARVQGQWRCAQENVFALVALKKYFDTYEKQTPNFTSTVWLGDRLATTQNFQGRSADRQNVRIPMNQLVDLKNPSILVDKKGTGRLYYRLGLNYAPTDLKLNPLDRGFVVLRTYEGVDNKSDVSRAADGTWTIKSGAKVRVRLTMVSESDRFQMSLVDKLPAGLEVQNPALATTPPVPFDDASPQPKYWGWWAQWFDHQNLRDDRVEAFSNTLAGGTYDYSYVARATTPGTFVVPPARAEEIFAPETFGRSASDLVIIK